MPTWKNRILDLLAASPGLTDREITDRLTGRHAGQQTANRMCRELEKERRVTRRARNDGKSGNYLLPTQQRAAIASSPCNGKGFIPGRTTTGVIGAEATRPLPAQMVPDAVLQVRTVRERNAADPDGCLSEDDVKRHVAAWLNGLGWKGTVAWGCSPGLDIRAERGGERWLIEAKGSGSPPAMRVDYFLAILGEILQRMDDPSARYSIALPNHRQFRGLWVRLPHLAKNRLGVTALFVAPDGYDG